MEYLHWNDLIASHFFRPEMAGHRVHLYVTEELIAELGRAESTNLNDFLMAVKAGPPWVTRQGICQKALQSARNWRQRNLRYPPYTGYLALFVLAAGIEGDFADIAYYPRLRQLLSEPAGIGQYPSFDEMPLLWDDLERWSNVDQAGKLGIFVVDIAGSWIYVGLPIAQTLLTEAEIHSLPFIFSKVGLDPTSPPSDRELAVLVARHGRQELRARTLRLLEGTGDNGSEARHALIETILEELRSWDGSDVPADSPQHQVRVQAALRLCCRLDEVSGRAEAVFRCKTNHDFPEEGLLLTMRGSPTTLICEEEGMGWSRPLSKESDRLPVDAALFDWSEDLIMNDPLHSWDLHLPGSPIRVFVNAAAYGLTGIVEERHLPRGNFYIAVARDSISTIEKWGRSSCKGFRPLEALHGVPSGWRFFHIENVLDDEIVRQMHPILTMQGTIRLRLDGGIRNAPGNSYFKFAPPRVIVEGGDASLKVFLNGRLLEPQGIEGIFELPPSLLSEETISIEAWKGDVPMRRLRIYLWDHIVWPPRTSARYFDQFGNAVKDDGEKAGIAGALVMGVVPPKFNFHILADFPGERRVYFVGRSPGEVVCWPKETVPAAWAPVWAIPMRRDGRTIFCGDSIAGSMPLTVPSGSRKRVRLWKNLLWHSRKKILAPSSGSLKALWVRFLKVAENVHP